MSRHTSKSADTSKPFGEEGDLAALFQAQTDGAPPELDAAIRQAAALAVAPVASTETLTQPSRFGYRWVGVAAVIVLTLTLLPWLYRAPMPQAPAVRVGEPVGTASMRQIEPVELPAESAPEEADVESAVASQVPSGELSGAPSGVASITASKQALTAPARGRAAESVSKQVPTTPARRRAAESESSSRSQPESASRSAFADADRAADMAVDGAVAPPSNRQHPAVWLRRVIDQLRDGHVDTARVEYQKLLDAYPQLASGLTFEALRARFPATR